MGGVTSYLGSACARDELLQHATIEPCLHHISSITYRSTSAGGGRWVASHSAA